MTIRILAFLLFSLHLYASPFIEPAKKGLHATVRIHFGGKKQSGFFISEKGEILTLYHPLQGQENIFVEHQNCYYIASLVSKDKKTDLALLHIEKTESPYLEIGSSRDIFPGEWVLLAGYPLRRLSVRRAMIATSQKEYLIVDTPFAPGEIGGPLLDLNGDAIGLNCGNSNRMGLSIPLDMTCGCDL